MSQTVENAWEFDGGFMRLEQKLEQKHLHSPETNQSLILVGCLAYYNQQAFNRVAINNV